MGLAIFRHDPQQEVGENTLSIVHMNLQAIKLNTLVALFSIGTSIVLCLVFVFDFGGWKADIGHRLLTVETQVKGITDNGSPIMQSEIRKHVAEDAKDAEGIKAGIIIRTEEVDRRLAGIEKNLDAINTFQLSVATLNGKLETMDAKLDGVRRTLEDNRRIIENLQTFYPNGINHQVKGP